VERSTSPPTITLETPSPSSADETLKSNADTQLRRFSI